MNAILINGQRPKRAKWNTDLWLYIGTWNVMSMLKPGKMNKIAEQIAAHTITDHCTARNKMERTWTN